MIWGCNWETASEEEHCLFFLSSACTESDENSKKQLAMDTELLYDFSIQFKASSCTSVELLPNVVDWQKAAI